MSECRLYFSAVFDAMHKAYGENDEDYQPERILEERQMKFEGRNIDFSRQCGPSCSTPNKRAEYREPDREENEVSSSSVQNETSGFSGVSHLDVTHPNADLPNDSDAGKEQHGDKSLPDADTLGIGDKQGVQDDANSQPCDSTEVETRPRPVLHSVEESSADSSASTIRTNKGSKSSRKRKRFCDYKAPDARTM